MSFPSPSDVVIGYLVGHITPTGKQFVPYAVYPSRGARGGAPPAGPPPARSRSSRSLTAVNDQPEAGRRHR